jgi:hypothetical protein
MNTSHCTTLLFDTSAPPPLAHKGYYNGGVKHFGYPASDIFLRFVLRIWFGGGGVALNSGDSTNMGHKGSDGYTFPSPTTRKSPLNLDINHPQFHPLPECKVLEFCIILKSALVAVYILNISCSDIERASQRSACPPRAKLTPVNILPDQKLVYHQVVRNFPSIMSFIIAFIKVLFLQISGSCRDGILP